MQVVKMLQTRKGTEDGFCVQQFEKGEVYNMQDNLARTFFNLEYAKKATACEVLYSEMENVFGKLSKDLNDYPERFPNLKKMFPNLNKRKNHDL